MIPGNKEGKGCKSEKEGGRGNATCVMELAVCTRVCLLVLGPFEKLQETAQNCLWRKEKRKYLSTGSSILLVQSCPMGGLTFTVCVAHICVLSGFLWAAQSTSSEIMGQETRGVGPVCGEAPA